MIRRIRKNRLNREGTKWSVYRIVGICAALIFFTGLFVPRVLAIVGQETLTAIVLEKQVKPSSVRVCIEQSKQGCVNWQTIKTTTCIILIEGERLHALPYICDKVTEGKETKLVARGLKIFWIEREVFEVLAD